jgi:hypothetical protein
MYRTYLKMSDGTGVVALGTMATLDVVTANQPENVRDYRIQIGLAGTTAQRPVGGDADMYAANGNGQIQAGVQFFDSTLGYIIVADGQGGWRNPASGASV